MIKGLLGQDLSFLRSRDSLRRIGLTVLVATIAGSAYAALAPRWYLSTATLVPAKTQRSSAGIASLLAGEAGSLASGLMEGAATGTDAARIAAVLQGTAVSDAAVERFDLRRRYDERYLEDTRDALWRHCGVKVVAKPGLVQVSCEDRDPVFARQQVEFLAERGNEVFRRVGVSSASEEVRFLERRSLELRAEADETSRRMREFQEEHRIVDLDSQAKAVVSSIAALNSQRIGKELELDFARTFSSKDDPTLRQLELQRGVMGQKLSALELEQPAGSAGAAAHAKAPPAAGGLFPAALQVPRLRAEYEVLLRDRKVAEAKLIYALERLEGARANEARDTSTFVILDPPKTPDRSERPRGLRVLAMSALGGLLLGAALEWIRSGAAARHVHEVHRSREAREG